MTCFHPLKAFNLGFKSNGKKDLYITSIDAETVVWRPFSSTESSKTFFRPPEVGDSARSKGFRVYTKENPYTGFNRFVGDVVYSDYELIPCGQCIGCRIDRSKQWANRCLLEMQYHKSTYFLTLTYSDDYLPPNIDDQIYTGTLVKRDFQLFMKRLRKEYAKEHCNKLRFFACGEYGSETFRPHYHAIIFGLELEDLIIYKRSPDGKFIYYNSEFLQKLWPQGYVVVAPASWNTCSYVARYVTKKLGNSEKDFYDRHNLQPEFTLMSRRPGIARQYYEDHPDLYDYQHIVVNTPDGGRSFTPPRYFNRLYDIDYPDSSAVLKEKRQMMAQALMDAKLKDTDLDLKEYLKVEEDAFKNRVSVLKRGGDFIE